MKTQRSTFPNGLLTTVMPMKVELLNGRDHEALAAFDRYMAGGIGIMELANLTEGIRIRLLSKNERSSFVV